MVRRHRQWTAYEIEQLCLRYPSEGPSKLAADFRRTTGSVDAMAAVLRLRSLNRRTRQGQTRRQRNRLKSHDSDRVAHLGFTNAQYLEQHKPSLGP